MTSVKSKDNTIYTFVNDSCARSTLQAKVVIRKQLTPQVAERHGLGWAEQKLNGLPDFAQACGKTGTITTD